MYYDKLTGNQYRITLRLFRDCGPNNVNNTGFDAQAVLAVYDGNGSLQFTTSPSFTGLTAMGRPSGPEAFSRMPVETKPG